MVCLLSPVFCLLVVGQGWAEDGVTLFQAGKFDDAQAVFEAVLNERPNDAVALYYLGKLTLQGAKSKAYFQQVVNEHPRHDLADDALFELAEADFAAGLYITARRKYQQVLHDYPESNRMAMVHYRVGLTFLAMNMADSALTAFHQVMAFPDVDAQSHARLGRLEALVQKNRQDDALREAQEWLARGAGDLEADVQDFVHRLSPEKKPKPVQVVGKYWIQVVAYEQMASAVAMQDRLHREGLRAEVGQKPNSAWHFVFAGPYADRAEAEKDQKRIEALIRVKSFVIER